MRAALPVRARAVLFRASVARSVTSVRFVVLTVIRMLVCGACAAGSAGRAKAAAPPPAEEALKFVADIFPPKCAAEAVGGKAEAQAPF